MAETGDRVTLVKIDMSRKKRIARRYNVTETPRALLLREGKVIRNIPPAVYPALDAGWE